MSAILGINIKEVWDYRLSTAVPVIDRTGGTWVVKIYSKSNPDYDPADPATLSAPVEQHDTGIKAVNGDEYDSNKVKVCYTWLKAVRDKYSRPDIEKLKPLAAKSAQLQKEYAEITAGMNRIQAMTSVDAIMKIEEMNAHRAIAKGEVK